MLRPTIPTHRCNFALYDIDRRSVRVGFAPSSATVSVETAVNPSRRCNRFVLWARTVKDGKWTAPSLHPFPQRGRGRGARIGMYEYAALPCAASEDCGSESRAGRREIAGRGAGASLCRYSAAVRIVSDDCGSESRAGRSLRQRRPAHASLRRLQSAFASLAHAWIILAGANGMETGRQHPAFALAAHMRRGEGPHLPPSSDSRSFACDFSVDLSRNMQGSTTDGAQTHGRVCAPPSFNDNNDKTSAAGDPPDR